MTVSQQLKNNIIQTIEQSTSLPAIDGKAREEYPLPVVAVDIVSTEAFEEVIQQVQRVSMSCTLRVHAGDDDNNSAQVESWIAEIDSVLADANTMLAAAATGLRIYSWIYNGSSQEWDDSILDVVFSVDAIAVRI